MIPTFVKVLGDALVCFDFGFSWNLPPIICSMSGVAAGVAGCYQETQKAWDETAAKLKKVDATKKSKK